MEYNESLPFEIIAHAGDGMNHVMEALDAVLEENYVSAKASIKQAQSYIKQAHRIQTDLVAGECSGNKSEYSILMVHAQDHLMNVILGVEMAKKIIAIDEKNTKRRE